MSEERLKEGGLDRILEIWNRRRRPAVLVFMGLFSAVVSFVFFLPDQYRATAAMLVESQSVPESFVRSVVTSEIETRLQTITQMILSRARLQELILSYDLYPDLRKRVPMEAVIEQMRKDILPELKWAEQRSGMRTTVAFTVSYRGSDPQKVADVTNTLASFYIDENIRFRGRQAAETAEILWDQLQEVRLRLEQQEQHEPSEKQKEPKDSSSRPTVLVTRIAELKQDLAALRSQYNDEYPDIQRIRDEIAALERQLAQEISSEGKKGTQDRTRDYKTMKELYDSLLKRYVDARLAENMEQRRRGEEFRILDPAIVPEHPSAPNRLRLIFFGLILSVMAASAAAALTEQLDSSFHTVDDLRSFSRVPVLVSIPKIVTTSDAWWRQRRFYLTALSVVLSLTLIVGASYYLASGNERLVTILTRGRS
jgi:uncharacterized protein involved in exopolysaccharide biosynthesis